MLRYLPLSVAIVAACVAVYATSLRVPPAEDQPTVLPVARTLLPPPAPTQPERPAVPASPPASAHPGRPGIPASPPTPAQPGRPVVPASPSTPAPAQRQLVSPARLPLPSPPPLFRPIVGQPPLGGHRRNRSRKFIAACHDIRCNRHRDFASHNRSNQVPLVPGVLASYWSYWPAYWSYWSYWMTWPRPSHAGFRSAGRVRAKYHGFKHRKDDDEDDDD